MRQRRPEDAKHLRRGRQDAVGGCEMLGELRHYGPCFTGVKHLGKGFEFFGCAVVWPLGLPGSRVGKYHTKMAPGGLNATCVASSS